MNKGPYSINAQHTSAGILYQIEDKEGTIYCSTFNKIWAEAILKMANSKMI